jgi:S1-C subfamily serine protease
MQLGGTPRHPHVSPAGILATLAPGGPARPHIIDKMVEGGPCHASGLVQPGDVLLEVDGADVRSLLLPDIQSKLIGPRGSTVTLLLQRGTQDLPFEVKLTRSVPLYACIVVLLGVFLFLPD